MCRYGYLPNKSSLTLQYLQIRFGKVARLSGTFVFVVTSAFYCGIVVYGPSLAFQAGKRKSLTKIADADKNSSVRRSTHYEIFKLISDNKDQLLPRVFKQDVNPSDYRAFAEQPYKIRVDDTR